MATEKGIVTKINAGKAWVTTMRTGACEACSARGACHTLGGGKEMEVEALNDAGADVGDHVVIGFETRSLFKISFLLYVVPIISLIIGAVIGDYVAPAYGIDPSLLAALFGFGLLGITFAIIRYFSRGMSENRLYQPKIIRKIPQPIEVEVPDNP